MVSYRKGVRLVWLSLLLVYCLYVLLWLRPFRYNLHEGSFMLPTHTYLSLAFFFIFVPGYALINLAFPEVSASRKIVFSIGLGLSLFPTSVFLEIILQGLFAWWWLGYLAPMVFLAESIACLSLAILREIFHA